MPKKNIFLIGPTGAGKTIIGKLLASELQFTFYDADQEIVKRAGMAIAVIFAKEGELGFRRREEQVIADLTQLNAIVLATGAGAVLSADSRALLMARGRIVYLEISLEQQLARLENNHDRPLLQTAERREVLVNMQKERVEFYKGLADLTVNVDGLCAMEAVNVIKQKLCESIACRN